MTSTAAVAVEQDYVPGLEELRTEFGPLFAAISEGALERERLRELAFPQVEQLKKSGFTALRIPREFGGRGVSFEDYAALLVDLATADSNVAHLLRGHVAYIERLLLHEPGPRRDDWLRRLGAGALIGNAASERQELTEITARLRGHGGISTVSGTKYYTTGSIYADWISLSALKDNTRHSVLVNARHHGVKIVDDWDGFGQQLTGSGSLTLDAVPVEEADIVRYEESDPHNGFIVAVFQTILLAVAAGIAQAAVDDVVAFVKPRRRTFGNTGELVPREQDIVQTVIGEAAAKAHAARLIVDGQARALGAYASSAAGGRRSEPGTDAVLKDAADRLALDVFKSQQVVLTLTLDTATEVFEVGGASATSTAASLDRHWRNARTVASHNPAKYRARSVGDHLLTGRVQLWGSRSEPASPLEGP